MNLSFHLFCIDKPIRASNTTVFPYPNEDIQTHTVGRLVVTTPFQTIIDLIRWDCEMEFVFQALACWEHLNGSLEDIWEGLRERGLLEKYNFEYAPYREDWVDVY